MRNFNFKLNKEILEQVPKNPMLEDENINEAMRVADDILEVFKKNKTNMMDSFMILSSLADSIYMYSTFGEELD